MKKNQDPTALFEQISTVENCYNTAAGSVAEEDLIAVILDSAPAEYQAVLTSEQRFKGSDLKKEDPEGAMHQHWRQLRKGASAAADDDNEIILSAIVCFECNEEGHKANQCPIRSTAGRGAGRGGRGGGRGGRSGGRGRGRGGRGGCFQGNGNHCRKQGHKATQCWDKEENSAQRPTNYTPRTGGGKE